MMSTSTLFLAPPKIEQSPIPASLRDIPQWGLWGEKTQDGTRTKAPFCAERVPLSHSQPETWLSYPEALKRFQESEGYFNGLSFCLGGKAPFCGIDFDHCRNIDTGAITPVVRQLVTQLASYTEVSTSKDGLHTWVKGHFDGSGRKFTHLGIEVYCKQRCFIVTGNHLPKSPDEVQDRQAVVDHLRDALDILDKLCSDKEKWPKAEKLFTGDTSDYKSHSDADMALCNMAAHAGATAEAIDTLIRLSGLYRDKWNEQHGAQTYGEMTIAEALAGAKKAPQGKRIVHRLQGYSAQQLQAEVIPPVHWIIRDLIPEGLTVIAGASKLGKSWAALTIGLGVASGTPVFKYFDTEQGTVLYLALEDRKRRMQGRLDVLWGDAEAPEALRIEHACAMMPDLLDQLEGWMEDHPATKLVIIDTFAKVQQRIRGNHNAYLADYDAVIPLQEFALRHSIAVMAVTHTNQKSRQKLDDPFNSINWLRVLQVELTS
jgi:hypothetical protein